MYGRANSITGWEALKPVIACGIALLALLSTCGRSRRLSVRSFDGPGRLIDFRRFPSTGTDRWATGRSLRRKGARFLVAGLVALTTGVRSSSVARRLTNVVSAWRRVGGKATRLRSRAWFWLAIAPKAWLAFAVRSASSLRREAIVPRAFEPWTRNWLKALLSLVNSANRRRLAASEGAKYL